MIRPGHSTLVGEVCIAASGNNICPVAPPLITQTSGTLLVNVDINNSASLNGFDIVLRTNSSVLRPANAKLGNVLSPSGLSTLALCIGGSGIGCINGIDNASTLHYSVVSPSITAPGVTGVLFVANYTIFNASVSSPITFQTGCTNTSVPGICVTIPSGSITPDTETAQSGKFSNKAYFDFQPFFTPPLIVDRGTSTSNGEFDLTVTTVNGFSGTVSTSGIVSPSGPTMVISPATAQVNATVPQVFLNVNVTVLESVSSGNYTLAFRATSGPLPPNLFNITLIVPVQAYSITGPAAPLKINATYSGSTTVSLSSLGNFAGNVNVTFSKIAGLNTSFTPCSCNRTVVSLTGSGPGSTGSAGLSFNSTAAGIYNVNVFATSGNLVAQTQISVKILDFSVNSTATGAYVVDLGKTRTVSVTFSDSPASVLHNMTLTMGNVEVNQITSKGIISPSSGIAVACTGNINNNPTGINVSSANAGNAQANCPVSALQLGNYTVTVTGFSGTGTHRITHSLTFPVQVVGPDFTVTAPPVEAVSQGNSTAINVVVTRLLGLNDTIGLTICILPLCASPPSASISPASLVLGPGQPNGTATITITASSQTPLGTYSLSITAKASTSTITHIIFVTVLVVSAASGHNVAVYSVTSSQSSATVGSNVPITIIVQNLGKFSENVTVVALVGDTSVAQESITNLAPATNQTVILIWTTNGYSPGSYTIGGKVLGVNGQTSFGNSLFRDASTLQLNAASSSFTSSAYFEPILVAALIVIIAILGLLFLQSRRKPVTQ